MDTRFNRLLFETFQPFEKLQADYNITSLKLSITQFLISIFIAYLLFHSQIGKSRKFLCGQVLFLWAGGISLFALWSRYTSQFLEQNPFPFEQEAALIGSIVGISMLLFYIYGNHLTTNELVLLFGPILLLVGYLTYITSLVIQQDYKKRKGGREQVTEFSENESLQRKLVVAGIILTFFVLYYTCSVKNYRKLK